MEMGEIVDQNNSKELKARVPLTGTIKYNETENEFEDIYRIVVRIDEAKKWERLVNFSNNKKGYLVEITDVYSTLYAFDQ